MPNIMDPELPILSSFLFISGNFGVYFSCIFIYIYIYISVLSPRAGPPVLHGVGCGSLEHYGHLREEKPSGCGLQGSGERPDFSGVPL